MDKLEEVKKLKQLLDEGIIDENDFKKKKAQLLELSNEKIIEEEKEQDTHIDAKVNENNKTLDDYEKELLKQSQIKENDDYYQKEKLKAKAKLDAEEEMHSKRKAEQKQVVDKYVNKTKRILKWILAIFLWLIAISSFLTPVENRIIYIIFGLLAIILGCMACPKITDATQKYQVYTMHKTIIVWIIVIIWLIICTIGGSTINSQINEENSNLVSINNGINN